MQIKLIPERGQDGKVDNFACLVDDIQGDPERNCTERTVYNFGPIGNGGLKKLVELSNSINFLLLESALENHRDSIVCSRSYGVVYLIAQILRKWKISANLLVKIDDSATKTNLYNFLPSLMAALLDYDTKRDSSLVNLQRHIYLPKNICFNASTIRSLIRSIHIFPGNPFKEISINCVTKNNGHRIKKIFEEKLLAWATSDCGPWSDFNDVEGMVKIVFLTGCLYDSVEKLSEISWQEVNEHLSELQAIRVESGAKTFLLTTRLTSMQLSIFNRLELKPPPLVIIEQSEQPVVTKDKVESDIFKAINLVHDPFFEASALNISNNI